MGPSPTQRMTTSKLSWLYFFSLHTHILGTSPSGPTNEDCFSASPPPGHLTIISVVFPESGAYVELLVWSIQ